jgi:adenine-specific DNA-methyltransferase
MAKKSKKVAVKRKAKASAKPIEQYEHLDKERVNNPHIGLVNESTDTEYGQNKKMYQYDPHLDPQLQWAGKAERTSFEVPVVSLHVHERIDPKTIIESVKKDEEPSTQFSLFEKDKKPLREAIEFYKHKEGWSNRLVAGDSLLIMNSLLEKEGMGGKVQMLYFDPPYGIKYGSNFQPFVNKRDVTDGSDEDLTQEPEMIKAFRDTWELGIHSYLSYLRDRLFLAKDLLHESGSVFVQISDENVHRVRELLDEVFGSTNFVSQVCYSTTSGFVTKTLSRGGDLLLWYAKDIENVKYRQLYIEKRNPLDDPDSKYDQVELARGERRALTIAEKKKEAQLPPQAKIFRYDNLNSQGPASSSQPFEFEGKTYFPNTNSHWKAQHPDGMNRLKSQKRISVSGNTLSYVRYFDDFPLQPITNFWTDIGGTVQSRTDSKIYVVQTGTSVIQRCLIMATDPGDLVLDITCGSGTTAYVAENWGRRWITCDTSRVAISLAKQRLLTANFDYYLFARPDEGISGGFQYKTVPHITLKSISSNEPPGIEVLFDNPKVDNNRSRVTGPFTVESIPAPFVKNIDETVNTQTEGDISITRIGETLRQDQWRDELAKTGVRAKGGAMLLFSRIETQQGTKYIQAMGETKEPKPQKVLIVFGPEHAPLDARVVELAIEEARQLKPNILLFCAFQFDEEAAKDIDETSEKLIGFKLLKAQMNMDLQTEDLKKQRNSNQSFWLIGQPDVRVHEIEKGDNKGKVKIEVAGFDYYNPKTGEVDSGGTTKIAMWMLDTDYDGRSLFPRQIFFPMAGPKDGWARLAKNLKAEIDEEKIEAFRGTVSLPFTPGKLIAVKIIDDRGIESLKIIKR